MCFHMGNRDTGLDPHSRARRKHRRPRFISNLRVLLLVVFVSLVVIAWYLGTLYTIARAKRGSPTRLTESLSHDISHMFSRRKTAASETGGAEDGQAGGLVDVAILDQDSVRMLGLNAGHHHALDHELRGLEEEIVHMDASVGHRVRSEQEQQHSGRQMDG